MAFSIRRLRWVIAAAVLVLIVVVSGYIVRGRLKALLVYKNLLSKTGTKISHDSTGVTFTQSLKDHTVITIHSSKATQVGDQQWRLHDVTMTVNSPKDGRTDRITGSEFNYDQKEGVVKAIGEVHIDLEAPKSLTGAGRGANQAKPHGRYAPRATEGAEPTDVIHVRTSGLVYMRKLGLAATDQTVEFRYGGIICTSQGAEFNTSESTLHLLAHVVADGVLHNQPVHLTATKADIDRSANIATLTHVTAESQGKTGGVDTASADLTVLTLRSDGSIETAKATGNVLLTSKTQRLTAAELDAVITKDSLPESAQFKGGVKLVDANVLRPLNGSATEADLGFDSAGNLNKVTATGSPLMTMTDKRVSDRGLAREMHGDTIVASFRTSAKGKNPHGNTQITDLHATGAAEAHGESLVAAKAKTAAPLMKLTTLTGDDIDLAFMNGVDGKAEPQKLVALGHTLLRQDAPAGERETSAGDRLDAQFSQGVMSGQTKPQMTLANAVQMGHVVVHRASAMKAAKAGAVQSAPTQEFGTATAERASYDGATEKLTLTGAPRLTQDSATLTAATVVLDDKTQDADAIGSVQATLAGSKAEEPTAGQKAAPYTHVLAQSAHFTHATGQAEFHGTDAQPAKMWQDASQVQAANLLMDDAKHTFSARGAGSGSVVHSVFVGAGAPIAGGAAKKTGRANFARVTSGRVDYSDMSRQAVFTGPQDVVIESDSGTIHAQKATAFLLPGSAGSSSTPVGGSLDKIVITGDVELDQPGRHGTGEQLVYTAATGESLLTGTPGKLPHIEDAQQGNITGASLLVGDAGSTVIVSGEDAATKGRVHTETHVDAKGQGKDRAAKERQ